MHRFALSWPRKGAFVDIIPVGNSSASFQRFYDKDFMKWVTAQSTLAGAQVQTAIACLIYLAISLLFFGTSLMGHFADRFIGRGADPPTQIWALAWWPHAIANHLNPFITRLLWPPTGYNLVWATSIPGPSLA